MYVSESFHKTWLAAGSSPVDWCEPNYVVTPLIAEFTNTFSNVAFLIAGPICMRNNFWRTFSREVSIGADIQFSLLLLIAISSMYFHASLSLMGQFLDEVFILWAIVISYASFLPSSFRPHFYHGKAAYMISIFAGIVMTALWSISPILNAFILMTTMIPSMFMQSEILKTRKEKELIFLSRSLIVVFILAILVWVVDRAFCGTLLSLNIPGLHNVWHIMSCFAFYLNISVYAFIKTEEEHPHFKPSVRFYPGTTWGLPYLYIRGFCR